MQEPKTVLIVDDADLVLESIDLLISAGGTFNTIRALGAAGAISHMQHAHIDVIVADVILAGSVSGIDVCRKAIERYPHVAIVVITADTEVERADIPKQAVFLRKPFGGEQLMNSIDAALEHIARVQTPNPNQAT